MPLCRRYFVEIRHMADIIKLADYRPPPIQSNGAREALREIFNGDEKRTDAILADLWLHGFKIVPLDPEEDADVGEE